MSIQRFFSRNNVIVFITLVAAIAALALLRRNFATPVKFYEGDDAAVSAGLLRLCSQNEIGPYYDHPPHFNPIEFQAFQMMTNGGEPSNTLKRFSSPPSPPYYRFDTMTGVYLLGYISCGSGNVVNRVLLYCFIAGLLFPLFLSLFLTRLFAPLPVWIGVVLYLLISVSPEVWFSGSAYLNDKILAVCLVSLGLVLLVYSRASLVWAGLSGIVFGLAVLMRFDSVMFFPAAVLIPLQPLRHLHRREILRGVYAAGVLLVTSGLIYGVVMFFMGGSVLRALASGTVQIAGTSGLNKFLTILAGFGIVPMIEVGVSLLAAIILILMARRNKDWPEKREAALSILPEVIVLSLLLLPEIIFLLSYPFSSTKYILFGSALMACIGPLFMVKFWQSAASLTQARLGAAFTLGFIILVVLAGFVPVGQRFASGDGLRYFGGWLTKNILPDHEAIYAKDLFACLEQNPALPTHNIVVKTTSWMFEESIAYEAVSRGWSNRIVPLDVEIGMTGDPEYPAMNVYINPANSAASIYVPSQADVSDYSNALGDVVLKKAAGSNAFLMDISKLKNKDCVEFIGGGNQ